MVQIAASILNANFGCLAEEVQRATDAGVDRLHLDVMDGHFVPNISFGAQVVASLKKRSRLPFEVHLMIDNPAVLLDQFLDAGSDLILFHAEVVSQPSLLLERIKAYGVSAGLVVNPATPVATLFPFLGLVNQILVMSVNPGFGGQEFLAGSTKKITFLTQKRQEMGLSFAVEVDGGINKETARRCRLAGADILVAGTYLFRAPDIAQAVRDLKGECW